MAGVPSQWEGTGREKRRKREGRGSLAMGGNGPGRKGRKQERRGSSQWEGTGQEERRKRESHRTPNVRTDFPMLKVGNTKYSDPGNPVAN
jgi:hypothetical protein